MLRSLDRLILLIIASGLSLCAQNKICNIPEPNVAGLRFYIDASQEKTRIEDRSQSDNPTVIVITNKNPFRYKYEVQETSRSLEAAITLDFLRRFDVAGSSTATQFTTYATAANTDALLKQLENALLEEKKKIEAAKVRHNDFLEATKDPKTACVDLVEAAENFVTNTSVDVNLKNLRQQLEDLKKNDNALTKQKLKEIERDLESLTKDYDKLAQALTFVKGVLNNHTAFNEVRVISQFSSPRRVTVTILRTDIRAEKATPEPIATVILDMGNVPISVSVGIGFSTIDEVKIVRQPASDGQGGVAATFGYESDSRLKPSGVAMLTGHLKTFRQFTLGASAGFVLSNRGDNADIEYILGPSVGFRENLIWITVGMHVARVHKLGGGFAIGDKIPASLQDPLPVQKNYRPGALFSLTFKIR